MGYSAARTPRWLLVVPVLPPAQPALRTTALDRLKRLGAITVKPSLFVLPESPVARDEIGWLKAEIERLGGELTAFAADSVDSWTDDRLVDEFRRGSEAAYDSLARDLERALEPRDDSMPSRGESSAKVLDGFHSQLAEIERLDFFGTPGRDRVRTLLATLRRQLWPGSAEARLYSGMETSYRRRHWVTRPRPAADRMASAWLIRRFVDPQATFGFALNAAAVADDAVPFDMFGVELSHRGDECTFEALRDRFSVKDDGVERLARLVHELDLKDGRYDDAGADTLARIIDGLQLAEPDDGTLLGYGMMLFEALYQSPALLGSS